MRDTHIFAESSESQVTRAIIEGFTETLLDHLETDVIIVGGGPSGLMCGLTIAGGGFETLVIERNNYLGGGFWIGGFLMSPVTFRAPAQEVLEMLGCPYREVGSGLYVAPGPHACSKLIAKAYDAGVKCLNFTQFDDVVLRENSRVAGAVVNWMPVSVLPRNISCADPIALESRFVVDSTGHDAVVVRSLERRKIIGEVPGHGAMWVARSEDAVVEYTGLVHPGLVVTGMAVSTLYGLPRMGPTFGAMLLSGKKAGDLIVRALKGEIDESDMSPPAQRPGAHQL